MRHLYYIISLVAALLYFVSCDWFEYTLPLVEITYPHDGAYLAAPVTIRAEVSDTDTIRTVVFFIDGEEIGQDSVPPYEQYWEVAYWADGHNHSITASATDEAGNIGLSNSVTVRVAPPPPVSVPDIISPSKNTVFIVTNPLLKSWMGQDFF